LPAQAATRENTENQENGSGEVPIIANVDVMLAKRKMSSGELAARVGITQANLSILKTNKAKAIRFSTLEEICRVLECQPGDILEYQAE
jgi:putative transcriptional regulator